MSRRSRSRNSFVATARQRWTRKGLETRRARRRPLIMEVLEHRVVLATMLVTIPGDVVDENDGETSLREAIRAANAMAGEDLVVLPAFEFGLADLAQYVPGGDANSVDEFSQLLETIGVNFEVDSETGLLASLSWNARLGFGLSERSEIGFFRHSGATRDGLFSTDGEDVAELDASISVVAAPSSESATNCAALFEDVVTTPNLRTVIGLGLLEAEITEGTPAAIQITAPTGLPLNLLEPAPVTVDFDIVIDNDDPVHMGSSRGRKPSSSWTPSCRPRRRA